MTVEVAPVLSFPGFYEEAAKVTAANGEYSIGRCVAGTALHIFRPGEKGRVVVPMAAVYRGIMDEVFRLEREGAI